MDRASILEQLEHAKRRVADCQDFIAQQRSVIGELSHAQRPTTEAQRFLATLEELLAMHVARRDQLEHELATAQPDSHW